MAKNVLYFPYINVPENEWLVQTLLYWEKVGSIVPFEYAFNPHKLSKFMGDLVNNELVTPIKPGEHLNKIPFFEDAFLNLVDTNEEINRNKQKKLSIHNSQRIHLEKMGHLSKELIQRKLAKESRYPWFYVEQITANFFMAYLSSVLGKCEGISMDPITDEMTSLAVFSQMPTHRTDISLYESRFGVLKKVLPTPIGENFNVKTLVDFKENHKVLLNKFRRHIEKELIEICDISDEHLREQRYSLFVEEITDERDEIISSLEQYWSKLRYGTISSVLPPAITTSVGIASQNWNTLILSVPILLGAIGQAFKSEQAIFSDILSNPIAYAALAQDVLGARIT